MKYSEIKSLFKIDIKKKDDARVAAFTHYLQNHKLPSGRLFRAEAESYVRERAGELKMTEAPELDSLLPVIWDVPFPPKQRFNFTFIDLFAGIGGFRQGFQNLNGKCVFTSEWNKYAKITYDANFGEVPFGDITQVDEKEVPDHDILIGGFPCQPFSLAGVSKKNSLGRQHGFLDMTQGTLFFDVARILKEKRPKVFLLENVKNLVSHDKKKTFKIILETLRELDYSVHYRVLDGKHYVPQHRERIIIVGFDNKRFEGNEEFSFPEVSGTTSHAIEDILEKSSEDILRYTLSDKLWQYLQAYAEKHRQKGNGFGFGLVNMDGIARTLSARYHKDGSEILVPQQELNPRRLTPRECARLQGFPDKFVIPVSNTQAYKQFGNSVVAPLMEAVGKKIIKALEIHKASQIKKEVQLPLQM